MTKKPDNPQAFPCQGTADGMTLHDYFAAAALQGILAAQMQAISISAHDPVKPDPDATAVIALVYADAMLKAREATHD